MNRPQTLYLEGRWLSAAELTAIPHFPSTRQWRTIEEAVFSPAARHQESIRRRAPSTAHPSIINKPGVTNRSKNIQGTEAVRSERATAMATRNQSDFISAVRVAEADGMPNQQGCRLARLVAASHGYAKGRAGYPWHKAPPGLEVVAAAIGLGPR